MPRRPRPTSRRPPPTSQWASLEKEGVARRKTNTVGSTLEVTLQQPEQSVRPIVDEEEEGEDEDMGEGGAEDEKEREREQEEEDADAPRVSQWVDEEELDLESSDEEEEDNSAVNIRALQDGLTSLPLGALRKAQHLLSRAESVVTDSDHDGSSGSEQEQQAARISNLPGKHKDKRGFEKRKNKHAPMETTSKRPVSRKKLQLEDKRPIPRDPRFLPLVGEFSAQRFQSQYGFLTNIHTEELSTLKDNLKRARKLLSSSPRDQREEREAQVTQLERAVKRAESTVNKDRREAIEQTALERMAKEEREKRKQGKGAWYMKQADKKEFLVRAKYDAIETDGGKSAVKKAIEKKQKKINQKEKKRRPFEAGSGEGTSGVTGQKRPRDGSTHYRVVNKRARFS